MKPGTSMNRPTSHQPRGGTPMASWTPPQGLAGSLCPKGGPQGDTAGGAGQRGAPGKSHFALPGLAAGSCSLVTPGPTSTRGAAAAGSSGHEGQRERRGRGRREAGGRAGSARVSAVDSEHLWPETQARACHHLRSSLGTAHRPCASEVHILSERSGSAADGGTPKHQTVSGP